MSIQVFCSIPGALAGLINGQMFIETANAGVLVSDGDLSADNLALFSSVPGYAVENDEQAAVRLAAEADAADATSARLRAAAAAAAAKAVKGKKP